MSLSADGRLVLVGGDEGWVRLFDAATLKEVGIPPPKGLSEVGAVALVPGRPILLVGYTSIGRWGVPWDLPAPGRHDGEILVWDYAAGRTIATLAGHDGGTHTIRVLPDGHTAVSGGRDRNLRVWDLDDGRQPRVLGPHESVIVDSALSSDGSTILAAEYFRGARAWDVATGKVKAVIPGSTTISVAIASDGRTGFVGKDNGSIAMWDLTTSAQTGSIRAHVGGVIAVARSSDGQYVISQGNSGDRTVRVWDRASGAEVRRMNGASALAMSVDDSQIVMTSGRFDVKRYDFSRPARYGAFEEQLPQAREALTKNPNDPAGLTVFGDWYAFRCVDAWAVEFYERARSNGGDVPALPLARCYWRLGRGADAEREFRRALERREAPSDYLNLCVQAVRRASGRAGGDPPPVK